MSRSDVHRLADMLMAADEIAAIVQRGRDAFDEDVVLRRAVERCLEIIGEASKAMSQDVTDAHPEIVWSDMAKVRDRLSHHYHRVDPHSFGQWRHKTSRPLRDSYGRSSPAGDRVVSGARGWAPHARPLPLSLSRLGRNRSPRRAGPPTQLSSGILTGFLELLHWTDCRRSVA